MPANCLAPIIKCAYKKAQQQIKEEAFQDGDFLQKVHQYLSSPDVLENKKTDFEAVIFSQIDHLPDGQASQNFYLPDGIFSWPGQSG